MIKFGVVVIRRENFGFIEENVICVMNKRLTMSFSVGKGKRHSRERKCCGGLCKHQWNI